MNRNKRNPFLKSYIRLAMICCLILVALFMYLNSTSLHNTERRYNQSKVDLIADDFKNQIDLLNNMALSISINSKYQPYYFTYCKYNEKLLLEDFEQSFTQTVLAKEAFLYYGGTNIFHSSGYTIELNTYLHNIDEQMRDDLRSILCDPGSEMQMLPLNKSIYVIFPLRPIEGETAEQESAVLCFVIPNESLGKRFQIVPGGAEGTICLYKDDALIYCNRDQPCTKDDRNVVFSSTTDYIYTLTYLPKSGSTWFSNVLIIQLALTAIVVLCLFVVARLFSNASYQSLEEIVKKYQEKIQLAKYVQAENILSEIDSMLHSSVQTNIVASKQLARDEKLIYKQCLQMLLDGNYSQDMYTYLKELHINISGPYYYVINLSFEEDDFDSGAAIEEFLKRLNGLSCKEDGYYIYALCNHEGRDQLISVICSIADEGQKDLLSRTIQDVTMEYTLDFCCGVGNVYNTLSKLHASWLYGMDNLYISFIQKQQAQDQQVFMYDPHALDLLLGALASGDNARTEELFTVWIAQMENREISVLMQKYFFSEFLSEISQLARRCHVTLSSQNRSLLVAASDVASFKMAALQIIYEFLAAQRHLHEQLEAEQVGQVCEYIQNNFAEYDISIDKTALELSLSTTAVRKAVLQQTGRMYKEHIIFLRIEYAKELLMQDYSLSEICRMVGYGNDSYFIKIFKKMTGMTPSSYRKIP